MRTIAAGQGAIYPALTIPGTIAPYQIVALSNGIAEPAATVAVQEGDRVRAGQVLAQLAVDDLEANLRAAERTASADQARTVQTAYSAQLAIAQAPTQVQQARATLVQARQTYAEALHNLDRDSQLVGQGYLPQQNLDEQRVVVHNDAQAVTAAQAQVQSALANQQANGTSASGLQAATVEQARQSAAAQVATADQLRRQIARATITSPVDGVVINRNLNPGEYPAGRQIFTVEANATVFAILTASAVQAYQIHAGDQADVTIPGLPRARYRGRVAALLDAGTPGSTNFTVKVAIPNPRHELRAGTPVQATVDLRPVRGIVIPTSAFVDDARSRVTAVQNGRTRAVRVAELATDGANSVVTGLQAGERIVRDGGTGVGNGQPVRAER